MKCNLKFISENTENRNKIAINKEKENNEYEQN